MNATLTLVDSDIEFKSSITHIFQVVDEYDTYIHVNTRNGRSFVKCFSSPPSGSSRDTAMFVDAALINEAVAESARLLSVECNKESPRPC